MSSTEAKMLMDWLLRGVFGAFLPLLFARREHRQQSLWRLALQRPTARDNLLSESLRGSVGPGLSIGERRDGERQREAMDGGALDPCGSALHEMVANALRAGR